MQSVSAALAAINEQLAPLAREEVPLAAARGRILVDTIASDIDSPPFTKALMDGYAIVAADSTSGRAVLEVLESITAGQLPKHKVSSGTAIGIMTGAPLPDGADAVVPVERTLEGEGSGTVEIDGEFRSGANVLPRGESMSRGESIFTPGHRLRPQDLALLAELGIAQVPVRQRPRVAVLATGDELVPPDQTPGPGQIRNSNETLLVGMVEAIDCEAVRLGIARDEPADLREKINRGLACDVLLLSGGVSAGVADLVPQALRDAGVAEVFHKVNLKPGKPIWFGTRQSADGQKCLVFGLPGNPVSSLVCFEIFVRTAIRGLVGEAVANPQPIMAKLDEAIRVGGDRTVYFPCCLQIGEQGLPIAKPVPWAGSSDLRSTTRANGMVVIDPGTEAPAGSIVPAMVWAGNVVKTKTCG